MRTALVVVALAIALVACQPQPQPVDLAPIQNAITNLNDTVTVLTARLDVLGDRVVRLDDNVRADLSALLSAATELQALVQQPLSIADADWTGVSGLIVTTHPGLLDFLTIAPGECPEDAVAGRATMRADEVVVSSVWPAPTGPHCITSGETEDLESAAVTVNVPAASVGSALLLPEPKTE